MQSKSTDNGSPVLFPLGTSRKSTRRGLWPTPQARDWKGKSQRGGTEGNRDCLPNAIGSLPAASHVPIFPLRVRERESGEVGPVFGLKCGELLGTYDPDSLSLRTLEQSLIEDWIPCLRTLPRSGWMRNGRIYEQATWMHRTEESVSGSWRTPASREPGISTDRLQTKDGQPVRIGERAYDKKTGRLAQVGLPQQVKMWPTPREFMYKDATIDRGKGNLGETVGGQLNPMWVEWLQGYPLGWTEV